MRRVVASFSTWWLRIFVLLIPVNLFFHIPWPWGLVLLAVFFVLFLVRPAPSGRNPVAVLAPVRGRWVAINSPGTAVPSHGVKAYGQMYAVDLVRPGDLGSGHVGWGLRGRPPTEYPAFGEPVHAMAAGEVVRVLDSLRDRSACNTWPRLVWMMTFGGFVRELVGVRGMLGNHVMVRQEDGVFAVYAHLQGSSARVAHGERVAAGQALANVGNTGNTSEPHLHVQLMDREQPTAAAGVPMRWTDITFNPVERDTRWGTKGSSLKALPGFPETGQVFQAGRREAGD